MQDLRPVAPRRPGVLKGIKANAKRFIVWSSVAFTLSALAVMFTPLANLAARPLIVGNPGFVRTDLLAILGGGAYPNGVLGSASNERFVKGLLLYRAGVADRVIFAGGPVLGLGEKLGHTVLGREAGTGGGVTEASLMAEAALAAGMDPDAIAEDAESLSTYENMKNIKAYMEREGLRTVTIVTSPTHMLRAALTAGKLGMRFQSAPIADYTVYRNSPLGRITLMREALWEYAAIAFYRAKGYI